MGMMLMSLCDARSVPRFQSCDVQCQSSVQIQLKCSPARLQIPLDRKIDCTFGKRIQLEPTGEIKEWEGPLHTAITSLS